MHRNKEMWKIFLGSQLKYNIKYRYRSIDNEEAPRENYKLAKYRNVWRKRKVLNSLENSIEY